MEKNQRKLEWNRMHTRAILSRLEIIALVCIGLGIILIGPQYAGGPITRDELYYMTTAMDPFPSFRGFHIYFLKLFLAFADPLEAVTLYWAWVVALTSVLVYVNGRMLSSHAHPLTGVFAVLLFWASQSIFRLTGVAYADSTVMLMMTLGTTLYLLYHHTQRRLVLVVFGSVLFFAMESKPTGLCLATLLAGLGLVNDRLHWKIWIRNLFLVALGIALGQGIFMILNHLYQPDILAGTQEYAVVKSVQTIQRPGTGNLSRDLTWTWYTVLVEHGPFLLILFLYMQSLSFTSYPMISKASKIIWLMPLAVILFLTVATLQVEFGGDRHIVPILPVAATLAAYALPLPSIRTIWQTQRYHLLWMIGGIVLIITAYFGIIDLLAQSKRWTPDDLHTLLDLPCGFILLAITILWCRTRPMLALTGWVLAVVIMILPPLLQIPTVMQHTRERSARYLYPVTQFADQMIVNDETTLFVSGSLPEKTGMLAAYQDIVAWIVSVVHNEVIKPEQVTFAHDATAVLNRPVTYAFLTKRDVARLLEHTAHNVTPFESTYLLRYDLEHDLVVAINSEQGAALATAVITDTPHTARARMLRAAIARHTNQPTQALNDYAEVLAEAPQNVHALIGRSKALIATGAYEQARDDLDRALALQPENTEAHFYRGCLAAEQGDIRRALADFNGVLESGQLYPSWTLPLAWYDDMLAVVPSYGLAYARRGFAQMEIGAWDAALEDFNRAIDLSPTWALPYAGRGKLYRLRGQWHQALDDLRFVLEHEPDDPLVYYEMGLTYADMGDVNGAFWYLSTALHSSTDAQIRADIRQRLPDLKPWEQWVQR